MIIETSAGIVPLKKKGSQWLILLVQLHAGHWGFPKGHMEKGEDLYQAAVRELQEETGLTVKKKLIEKQLEENYHFTFHGKLIKKKVIYFVAEVEGVLKIQQEEVKDAKWVALKDAEEIITFPAGKAVCKSVQALLI